MTLLSNDMFMSKVKKLTGDEFTFLDTYTGYRNEIRCRHNKCGFVFKVKPYYFLSRPKCPNCNKNDMISIDRIRFIAKNNGFELLSIPNKLRASSRITVKHIRCGSIKKISASYFIKSPFCTLCKRGKDFSNYVKKATNGEYEVIGVYKNMDTKLKMKHKICGKEYLTTPHSFHKGYGRCPACSAKNFKNIVRDKLGIDNNTFIKRVHTISGNRYTFLDKYVNAITKLRCKHNKCGFIFEVSPHDFYKGSGCPKCNESKGERFVEQYLLNKHIKYKREFIFNDLVDKLPLRFDFYLPESNLCIEYDGKQHFSEQSWMGGKSKFMKQQKHDLMKDKYCLKNKIRLIRLNYKSNTYDKVKKELDLQL